jgi:broad specificity phosphatase PhoE
MCNKTLYWIRHGESLSNISESNYSIIDPGLTPNGITQCETLKTYITNNKIIDKYKFINFNKIIDKDEDLIYKKFNGQEPKTNVISRCEWFVNWLKKRKEKNIMIITHGNFLLPMFTNILTDVENKNFFSNCEIRRNILI